jgi:hypothetical protein
MAGTIIKQDVGISVPEVVIQNKSGITRTKREGTVVRELAVATYDVSGGDDGTAGTHGTGVYLPANAIITNVFIDISTTFTDGSSDSATLAVGYTGSTGAFTAAIAISDSSNVWDAGVHGTKVGNWALDGNSLTQIAMGAARAATFVKLSAIKEIVVATATATLTAGKMNIYVEYVVSD